MKYSRGISGGLRVFVVVYPNSSHNTGILNYLYQVKSFSYSPKRAGQIRVRIRLVDCSGMTASKDHKEIHLVWKEALQPVLNILSYLKMEYRQKLLQYSLLDTVYFKVNFWSCHDQVLKLAMQENIGSAIRQYTRKYWATSQIQAQYRPKYRPKYEKIQR